MHIEEGEVNCHSVQHPDGGLIVTCRAGHLQAGAIQPQVVLQIADAALLIVHNRTLNSPDHTRIFYAVRQKLPRPPAHLRITAMIIPESPIAPSCGSCEKSHPGLSQN